MAPRLRVGLRSATQGTISRADDGESPSVGLDRGVQPIGVYVKLRERSSRLSSCWRALRTTPMLNRDSIGKEEEEEEEAPVLY